MRRTLFLSLTSLMFLTAFSSSGSNLGWWDQGLHAPLLKSTPEVIESHHGSVLVTVDSAMALSGLEISWDAGEHWVAVHYLPRVKFTQGKDLKSGEMLLPLKGGNFEHLFSHEAVTHEGRKIRSMLVRGISTTGQRTAPRSLALIYKSPKN